MADYNVVILVGRLTRDPELQHTTAANVPFVKLSLAVGRSFRKSDGTYEKKTDFIDVVVWGRQAETSAQYLHKGSSILVNGEVEQQRWQDKTSGQKKSKLVIRAQRVQFLDPKGAAPTQTDGTELVNDDMPEEGYTN